MRVYERILIMYNNLWNPIFPIHTLAKIYKGLPIAELFSSTTTKQASIWIYNVKRSFLGLAKYNIEKNLQSNCAERCLPSAVALHFLLIVHPCTNALNIPYNYATNPSNLLCLEEPVSAIDPTFFPVRIIISSAWKANLLGGSVWPSGGLGPGEKGVTRSGGSVLRTL